MSFDSLYECRIPWHAIERVMFLPEPPPAPNAHEPVEDDDESAGPPFLRLVT